LIGEINEKEIRNLSANSKSFRCAAEQNTVNLSCSCWQIPKIFAPPQNKTQSVELFLVTNSKMFRRAAKNREISENV
jgi:hypothetical protein